ncbi:hypothetical protein VV11_023120 [Trichodesmium erythraeum 21-75]|nr:hypothetical protein [Trichodesmium erythraeum 21-75]
MQSYENFLMGGRKVKNLLEIYVERPFNYWLFERLSEIPSLEKSELELSIERQKLIVKVNK